MQGRWWLSQKVYGNGIWRKKTVGEAEKDFGWEWWGMTEVNASCLHRCMGQTEMEETWLTLVDLKNVCKMVVVLQNHEFWNYRGGSVTHDCKNFIPTCFKFTLDYYKGSMLVLLTIGNSWPNREIEYVMVLLTKKVIR